MKKMIVVFILGFCILSGYGFYVIPIQGGFRSWYQKIDNPSRFRLCLNDKAVLDKETGLVWQRNTDEIKSNWEQACDYCYRLEVGNRKGWRIPTIEELASLVDNDNYNPALPTNHPFTNVQSSFYWSGSTYASYPGFAWGVYFRNGDVYYFDKDYDYDVRCVRGGHGYDTR